MCLDIWIKQEKYQKKKWAVSTGDGKLFFPKQEENNNCVFADIGLANPDTGKIYTDLTGCFPVTSNRGMQYMLILYAYDTNAILVEPIKTRSYADIFAHIMPYVTN